MLKKRNFGFDVEFGYNFLVTTDSLVDFSILIFSWFKLHKSKVDALFVYRSSYGLSNYFLGVSILKRLKRGDDAMDKDRSEIVKVYCDFQKFAITETARALTKGITYYFLIMAVLTGILLTQEKLPKELQILVLIISVMVSVLLAVAGLTISHTLYEGVKTLSNSLQKLDEALFTELQMDKFIARGLKNSRVVLVCSCLVLLTIVIGMCLIAVSENCLPKQNP